MALPDLPVLRPAQLRALGLAAQESYLELLADHVVSVFPTHATFIGGRRGERLLRRCLAAARGHGLFDRHSVALYTDLVIALGEGYEAQPRYAWICAILQARGLGAVARMFLIYQQLPERCPDAPLSPPPDSDDDGDDQTGNGGQRVSPPLLAMSPSGFWG